MSTLTTNISTVDKLTEIIDTLHKITLLDNTKDLTDIINDLSVLAIPDKKDGSTYTAEEIELMLDKLKSKFAGFLQEKNSSGNHIINSKTHTIKIDNNVSMELYPQMNFDDVIKKYSDFIHNDELFKLKIDENSSNPKTYDKINKELDTKLGEISIYIDEFISNIIVFRKSLFDLKKESMVEYKSHQFVFADNTTNISMNGTPYDMGVILSMLKQKYENKISTFAKNILEADSKIGLLENYTRYPKLLSDQIASADTIVKEYSRVSPKDLYGYINKIDDIITNIRNIQNMSTVSYVADINKILNELVTLTQISVNKDDRKAFFMPSRDKAKEETFVFTVLNRTGLNTPDSDSILFFVRNHIIKNKDSDYYAKISKYIKYTKKHHLSDLTSLPKLKHIVQRIKEEHDDKFDRWERNDNLYFKSSYKDQYDNLKKAIRNKDAGNIQSSIDRGNKIYPKLSNLILFYRIYDKIGEMKNIISTYGNTKKTYENKIREIRNRNHNHKHLISSSHLFNYDDLQSEIDNMNKFKDNIIEFNRLSQIQNNINNREFIPTLKKYILYNNKLVSKYQAKVGNINAILSSGLDQTSLKLLLNGFVSELINKLRAVDNKRKSVYAAILTDAKNIDAIYSDREIIITGGNHTTETNKIINDIRIASVKKAEIVENLQLFVDGVEKLKSNMYKTYSMSGEIIKINRNLCLYYIFQFLVKLYMLNKTYKPLYYVSKNQIIARKDTLIIASKIINSNTVHSVLEFFRKFHKYNIKRSIKLYNAIIPLYNGRNVYLNCIESDARDDIFTALKLSELVYYKFKPYIDSKDATIQRNML
jgi:hypothetical protein